MQNEYFVVVAVVVVVVTIVCVVVSTLEAREENRQNCIRPESMDPHYTSVFLWFITFLNKNEQTFSVV